MIYPENYPQSSCDGTTLPDGTYDFSRLSVPEVCLINEVLRVSTSSKYPQELHALGMVNESEPIRYKPRYVLNEIIVQTYAESEKALDLLAVGFAYKAKGAAGRKLAIEYFERYQQYAKWGEKRLAKNIFFNVQEPFFSYGLAELYSSEYQFDLALEYATHAEKHNSFNAPGSPQLIASILLKTDPSDCVDYLKRVLRNPKYSNYRQLFLNELSKAQKKMESGYTYRPRPYTPKAHEIELEKQISALASEFLPGGKYYDQI